jgi:type IV pilus assembly protein PilC
MNKFSYLGIQHEGQRIRGTIMANSLQDAERQLGQMNMTVVFLKPQKDYFNVLTRRRVSQQDVITMTFQVNQLLRSGVPLIDILSDIQSSYPRGYFRDVLAGLYDAMLNGATYSQALSRYPNVFDEVYISLIAVGEKTGQLELILHDLGVNIRWQDELAAKTKKILIYPSIVFSVVMLVISFLMIFLVPELVDFVRDMGQELGFLTLSLMTVSHYFVHYWHIGVLVILAMVLGVIRLMNDSRGFRKQMHQWQLAIPIVGVILFKLKIARMTNTMAIMYAAGISIQQMMQMAGKLVGNDYLQDHLEQVEKQILEGNSLTQSFSSSPLFPPLILKLIKVGESTGRMDEALRNISYFYDREAKELIEKVEPTIEPVITLILATLVAWVMLATLGPVYDVMGKIK